MLSLCFSLLNRHSHRKIKYTVFIAKVASTLRQIALEVFPPSLLSLASQQCRVYPKDAASTAKLKVLSKVIMALEAMQKKKLVLSISPAPCERQLLGGKTPGIRAPSRPVGSSWFLCGPLGSFTNPQLERECTLHPSFFVPHRCLSCLFPNPPFSGWRGKYFTSLEKVPLKGAWSLPLLIHLANMLSIPTFSLHDLRCGEVGVNNVPVHHT